jgi:hypothetical protein
MAATTHHDLSAEFTLYAITGPGAYSCLGAGKVRMAATIHRFRVVIAASDAGTRVDDRDRIMIRTRAAGPSTTGSGPIAHHHDTSTEHYYK